MIQLVTAFGAIGLLMRMSPAVQDILAQNVYSTAAAEDAMSAMLLATASDERDQTIRLTDALSRARQNVTEADEIPAIDDLERFSRQAIDGDLAAIVGAVEAAERLTAINRAAMQRANARALRLGSTGAWAAVTLALVGFAVSILVVRRTIFGVVEPVEELEAVVAAYRGGDHYRRCQGRAASREMRHVLDAVNDLLDRAHRTQGDELASRKD
ncbi:MAG TPA: hypothetical protein PLL30_02705 [Candidatus Krumholzibacteria bacterium]|nr:hypothetical protein [Candidatus Krumholzibacteria bacterium]HPD70680.1 hypothetical protein [Candidatus Krumholzibacteria bacterium]HRY39620.1 hypothetical protein [Candidatus Krumholzibacteria bacterium]